MEQSRHRRLRHRGAGFIACVLMLSAGVRAENVPVNRVLIPGLVGSIVQRAIIGAMTRLERPRCAALFERFQASDGSPLASRLSRLSLTPSQYLATLWFADADDTNRCHTYPTPIAYTAAGNTVVYVCSAHFVSLFGRNRPYAEITVIHEMLHAAGLGENPPTSEHISRVAWASCGAR